MLGFGLARQQGGSPAVPFVIEQPAEDAGHGPADTGVDVLSDTRGVNFNPYIRGVVRAIHDRWVPLLPPEARAPKLEKGTTVVRFRLGPDGTMQAIKLEESSRDVALNRAAWRAITDAGQFPPLPKEFTGPNLELRMRFLVNEGASTAQATTQ